MRAVDERFIVLSVWSLKSVFVRVNRYLFGESEKVLGVVVICKGGADGID